VSDVARKHPTRELIDDDENDQPNLGSGALIRGSYRCSTGTADEEGERAGEKNEATVHLEEVV
jgi:hypothetical protein